MPPVSNFCLDLKGLRGVSTRQVATSDRLRRFCFKICIAGNSLLKKTAGAVIGIILALPLIYWLRPLNKSAITILVAICALAGGALAALIELLFKKKEK